MPVSDYTGDYGGTQRGSPYLWQNPETGEIEYREGDPIEVSPNSQHRSVAGVLARSLPYFAAPLGAAGLEALAGPATSAISGSAMGSAPGYMAPAAAPATATPAAMTGTSMLPAAAPASSAMGTASFLPAAAPAAASSAAPVAAMAAPAAAPLASQAVPNAPNLMPQTRGLPWEDIIRGGAEIGTGLYTANRSRNAANEAAQTQTQAGERALGINREALGPYMNLGGQAANTLGGLMGFSPMPSPVSAASAPASGIGAMSPRSRPEDVPATGFARPRSESTQTPGFTFNALRPVAAQAQTQSGYVRMQDDEGRVVNVPAARAAEFERMGARRAG